MDMLEAEKIKTKVKEDSLKEKIKQEGIKNNLL